MHAVGKYTANDTADFLINIPFEAKRGFMGCLFICRSHSWHSLGRFSTSYTFLRGVHRWIRRDFFRIGVQSFIAIRIRSSRSKGLKFCIDFKVPVPINRFFRYLIGTSDIKLSDNLSNKGNKKLIEMLRIYQALHQSQNTTFRCAWHQEVPSLFCTVQSRKGLCAHEEIIVELFFR